MDAFINLLGFKGWVSYEVFSRFFADADPDIPRWFAKRASEGWDKIFGGEDAFVQKA